MLKRKMLRDIRKHKFQFLSIFLMAFLGAFIFAGVCGETLGLEANANQFYEETNLADGWIYSYYLNDLFIEQTYYLGATTQVERQVVIDSEGDFENKPDIRLHFVENNTLSKFYLEEGEPLNIDDPNGVWLDRSFAKAKGLKVGDDITFKFENYSITKEIKGLGYSPEYVYHDSTYSVLPDFNKLGFAYMSYKAFPSDTVPYNVLNVKFDGRPEIYAAILAYRLDGYYTSFIDRSEHTSFRQFSDQIQMHKMISDIFPAVFIAVAMLILLTTMTRIIAHQRSQIGILKANGFKNRSIIIHYLSYGFLPVLTGSVLGLILGPTIVPRLLYSVIQRLFILPTWNSVWSMEFIYMTLLMIALSLIVSVFSARSISNEKPSESIKPKPPKSYSSGFIERFRFWKRLSFNVRWNYRDAKRNRFRAIMTIIGVMGCTMLLICAFGLHDSINDLQEWGSYKIAHYDSKLIIDNQASQAEIDAIAKETGGDELMESVIEIESSTAKKSGTITVLDGTDLVTPTDDNQNPIEIRDDEISISKKMAINLGVGIGDEIKWHIMDSNKWVNTKIDKIHSDSNSQGLVMSKDKLESLGLNYTPTSIVTAGHIEKNYSAIKSSNTREARLANWNGILIALWILIYVLILFASILAVVVLYNLGLMSFTEIEREIATLKILGFKAGALRRLLLTQNLWFTTLGFVLGVPAGYYILKTMLNSIGESYYVLPRITFANFLLTGIITFSLSIIVNRLFSSKIKALNMVETLKDGE